MEHICKIKGVADLYGGYFGRGRVELGNRSPHRTKHECTDSREQLHGSTSVQNVKLKHHIHGFSVVSGQCVDVFEACDRRGELLEVS